MRTILVILAIFILLGPIGLPLLLIEWIIGKFNPGLRDRSSKAYVMLIFRVLLFFAGTKVTVIGRENIPDDRPVLYTSNHRGFFDIVAGYPQVKGLCGFVGKKELGKVPVLRIWMRLLHCHLLDRQDTRAAMQTIMDSTEEIKNGVSMWICPEGTRGHGDSILEFKAGSFRMAERSGCPVIPVAITHTDDILENHFPWIHATHVTIEFSAPIETAELDRNGKRNLAPNVQSIVEEMYLKNLNA